MAFMRLGSKSDAFHREGQTWNCTTGLPSDVTVKVGEIIFFLHKFPLLSRSGLLKKMITDFTNEEGSNCFLQLDDVPGGDKTFALVTKFFYNVKIDVTASNVVSMRCAAEYLQMNENYGEGNLIAKTETFLNEVFSNWSDSIKALQTCEEVKTCAEELHIVSRCIDSLAMRACSEPNIFNRYVEEHDFSKNSTQDPTLLNVISSETKSVSPSDDWWYEDLCLLSLPLFKRLILAIDGKGMNPENIARSLIYYIKRFVPLMNSQATVNDKSSVNNGTTTTSTISEADQRSLLEEILILLPDKKGVTPSKYLLRLLRTAMILHASPSCIENLEKRIGSQLHQAELVDLLIPNMGHSVETLYDIDCIHRIVDHFMSIYQTTTASTSPCKIEEGSLVARTDALAPMTIVANLIDSYLAEVAHDVNLKLPKFQALASAIPDYARPLDDGLYHAIDVYLKTHPWLVDFEREQFCRLMNCQKLSLEASTHVAKNERLPLRVIVEVLFFEQLRLRTSISSWLYVSENLENSQRSIGNPGLPRNNDSDQLDPTHGSESLKDLVSELEKECSCIKNELQKLAKTKKSWSIIPKIFCRKNS
ncbi:BTB/POZ domain-containing protein At5g03250-like [Vigna umbellata]|uniref:BTB/POZ domain-containing protein At5g03250-like n=1 Tax=Vigna umbellata TaxID=87088 RepID=UPI001F5EF5BC|nr:BTB/POZ domain-containing protein At5g03250-like [Vigna umbellata]